MCPSLCSERHSDCLSRRSATYNGDLGITTSERSMDPIETAYRLLSAVKNPRFTRWKKWTARHDLQSTRSPGIYIMAHLKRVPRTGTDPRARAVVYIGQTCGQTLRKRLDQFHKSASTGKRAHSGGRRYYRTFGGVQPELYFAVLPVIYGRPRLRDAAIQLLESYLLDRYRKRWKRLPVCNYAGREQPT